MELTLDIECIPNLDAAAIEEITAAVKAPGNYKKPESIAEWMAENREGIVNEQIHKACFAGETGQIICIGWAFDEQEPEALTGPEPEILSGFFAKVKQHVQQEALNVIGHNVSFDIRYIWQRAVINGIRPPWQIKWHAKPWDHHDTMAMWHPDRDKKISLGKLCKALGIQTSKSDLDGSKVWDYYKAGKIQEIAAYCKADVAATRQCYRRMVFAA